MALVSPSPPPSGSLYPSAAPLYARTSPDSPPTLVRALPTTPGSSSASTSGGLGAGRTSATGMNAGSAARREGSGGSAAGGLPGGSVVGGVTSPRPGGSVQPPRARTASAPRADASASSSSSSLAANDGLTPPLLPTPSRASSTPPTSVGSSSVGRTSSSSSLRGDGPAHSVPASAASSSSSFSAPNVPALPRLAPAHLGGGAPSSNLTSSRQSYFPASSQPFQQGSYMAQVALPPFQGPPFPHFAQAYPNPAYPFIPSPHPNAHGGMPAFAYNGANGFVVPNGGQLSPDQQKRLQHYQQQWQMEMIKHQQDGQARRRATSGPAPSHGHSPSFNSASLPYPPSPSPSLHQQPFQLGGMAPPVPSLPPGAMLPHFGVHGYPTPPGSTEGARAGGDSSGSSNGSSARGADAAYHPYRRHHMDESRSSSHRATSSNGSSASPARAAVAQKHGRNESSVSIAQLAQENYGPPMLPHQFPRTGSSSSVSSQGRSSPPTARNAPLPQTQAPPSFPRSRTDSGNSSASSSSRSDPHARPSSSLRTNSFDTARSATPVQARTRPSPLAAGPAHDDSSDDGADSDGTAEATATISTAQVVPRPAAPAAPVAAPAPAPTKEKEKMGMKSRFKKAFGVSNSASSSTLTEAELDGRGPKQLNGGVRARRDSSSSSEGEAAAPKVPYATHQSHASVASSAQSVLGDGASTTTSRKPPSSRFRLMNGKFNGSSDNLSISSTVSSASVMIRKLGQMGKLARRNSLMGLTKAFKKDKSKDDESAVERDVNGGKFLGKKDKKKAGVADASVSHATAEFDFKAAQSSGMSPAAALARRQQMAYAEQEAEEERARQAAAEEAARLGPPRSFEQLPAHARTESSASDASSIRKDKSRKGLGLRGRLGFGGSKTDLRETASVNDDAVIERGGSALGHYDDTTPRGSLEILAPPNKPYATYDRDPGQDSEEYEPSLYREGAVPRRGPVRPVKGILKGAGSYRQEDFAAPRAPFIRNRASSFDAPQQQARSGSPGNAALVNTIPSEQQVDGVAPMSTSPRNETHPPSPTELIHESAAARVHPETTTSGPYSNPGLNASAPVLNHFTSSPSMRPAPQVSTGRRRIVFAQNLSVHTTWPATIYDRRAEPATCNRLTPLLAQQIKEELNSFKMEEMDVHPMSRKLTHFFV
ncbi:hypothetical protein JCM10296v2_005847 [Rhodotorula toruloides]